MTIILSIDCSFCGYTFYADNRSVFLKRTHQTTVGAVLVDMHESVAI